MKLFAKLATATLVVGGVVYAAPGGLFDANGPAGSTADNLLAQVASLQVQMRDDYRYTQHLQLEARNQKDIIKLNCVNDKLVEMKPNMNIVDRARLDIQGFQDANEQRSAFDQASQAAAEVKKLREAAEGCVGHPLLATDTANEFTHPDLPDNPTDDPGGGTVMTIEPPGYASPYN
jgi:hypothetical protein